MTDSGYVHTQAELAERLQVSQGRISQLKKRRKWPKPDPERGWPVEACREALVSMRRRPPVTGQHVPRRGRTSATSSSSTASGPSADSPSPAPAAGTGSLGDMDSEAHPRAIALAAVRIAAEALKRASEAGTADVRDVDALKKALSELRMVERDYLKLAVERGELVHRDQAAEVAGYLARVAVEALHDIEVRLAAQVMIWLEDPLFREKGQRERERSVKQWAADRVYEVRAQTARDLNDLLGEVA